MMIKLRRYTIWRKRLKLGVIFIGYFRTRRIRTLRQRCRCTCPIHPFIWIGNMGVERMHYIKPTGDVSPKMCQIFNWRIYTSTRKWRVGISTYRRCVQKSKIRFDQDLYWETEDSCGKLFNPREYGDERNWKFTKYRNKYGKGLLVETSKPEPLTEKIRWWKLTNPNHSQYIQYGWEYESIKREIHWCGSHTCADSSVRSSCRLMKWRKLLPMQHIFVDLWWTGIHHRYSLIVGQAEIHSPLIFVNGLNKNSIESQISWIFDFIMMEVHRVLDATIVRCCSEYVDAQSITSQRQKKFVIFTFLDL